MAGEALIRPATSDDLDRFFAYLDDHLRDNGSGATALFMPMPRAASRFGPEREKAFRSACACATGQPGWRRLWLAFDSDGAILGHIDLRARPEGACAHRALLGMGVHRDARKQGLGARLIAVAAAWAASEAALDWIDLEVLSVNLPARQLYARCGFVQTGEAADMFRIDGESLGYTFMSLALR
ncbi:GNAT family N-acetyltransferase [Massilia violaceinigra]|uniref:GNAT family N-acetyltransferase n=1 Tax=Massilia violaceinigra TaxID=2045208 RepID=A0ABY4AB65_9BURK|nr:GNAT family N-acetyltransferase [Massilia violaceinigra]UOD32027.1 GNAT family N-acetyltransferase [Massilia violaceinigra]